MQFLQPQSPLIVSVPHAGTTLLPEQSERMTEQGLALVDTDWHVDQLAAGLDDLGAGLIIARHSRYVIDLNRSRDDTPLYASSGTGLVPTESFEGRPLYREGQAPEAREVAERIEACWSPYHQALKQSIESVRQTFGHAILLDLHSIASRVPSLFEGQLPDLNLGTFDGRSCAQYLQNGVARFLAEQAEFSTVINGRFKGGYITRHYGQPEANVHALQLEISQACYLDESRPQVWHADRASRLKAVVRALAQWLISWKAEA